MTLNATAALCAGTGSINPRSKLGRLVKDLGLTVERTMGDDLLQVFRLLCERSQQWWKQAQA